VTEGERLGKQKAVVSLCGGDHKNAIGLGRGAICGVRASG
jgi:hypothetical protein